MQIIFAIWTMIVASAPGLLVGFVVAGIVHFLLPEKLIQRWLAQPGFGSILRAAALGLPLTLCSCSVIPVAIALRRRGASVGATASFLISTPEIGVDSFFLSYSLLGLNFALIRTVAAFFTAMTVGVLVELVAEKQEARSDEVPSCCQQQSCCEEPQKKSGGLVSWFHYGFVELVDDIAPLLFVGFIVGGLISALVPPEAISALGLSPFLQMVVMLAASLPTYVCAATSTPIAAALISKGLAPGAALVFLLAGPASNLSTILATRREFGLRASLAYIAGIVVMTLIVGGIVGEFDVIVAGITGATHHEHTGVFNELCAVILLALLGGSCARTLKRMNRSHAQ